MYLVLCQNEKGKRREAKTHTQKDTHTHAERKKKKKNTSKKKKKKTEGYDKGRATRTAAIFLVCVWMLCFGCFVF